MSTLKLQAKDPEEKVIRVIGSEEFYCYLCQERIIGQALLVNIIGEAGCYTTTLLCKDCATKEEN